MTHYYRTHASFIIQLHLNFSVLVRFSFLHGFWHGSRPGPEPMAIGQRITIVPTLSWGIYPKPYIKVVKKYISFIFCYFWYVLRFCLRALLREHFWESTFSTCRVLWVLYRSFNNEWLNSHQFSSIDLKHFQGQSSKLRH